MEILVIVFELFGDEKINFVLEVVSYLEIKIGCYKIDWLIFFIVFYDFVDMIVKVLKFKNYDVVLVIG